jgi:hypothetical protein
MDKRNSCQNFLRSICPNDCDMCNHYDEVIFECTRCGKELKDCTCNK